MEDKKILVLPYSFTTLYHVEYEVQRRTLWQLEIRNSLIAGVSNNTLEPRRRS